MARCSATARDRLERIIRNGGRRAHRLAVEVERLDQRYREVTTRGELDRDSTLVESPNAMALRTLHSSRWLTRSMVLQHSTDRSLADWVTLAKVPWHELAKFGPHLEFEAHARLRYLPDEDEPPRPEIPPRPDSERSDAPVVGELCELLAMETSTLDQCFFCLWDGWPDIARDIHPGPPTVHIPNRSYHLFTGPLSEFGQWSTTPTPYMPPAAFVWPADHAWCIAADVDQPWAGISATSSTVARLVAQTRIDIVPADPTWW